MNILIFIKALFLLLLTFSEGRLESDYELGFFNSIPIHESPLARDHARVINGFNKIEEDYKEQKKLSLFCLLPDPSDARKFDYLKVSIQVFVNRIYLNSYVNLHLPRAPPVPLYS